MVVSQVDTRGEEQFSNGLSFRAGALPGSGGNSMKESIHKTPEESSMKTRYCNVTTETVNFKPLTSVL